MPSTVFGAHVALLNPLRPYEDTLYWRVYLDPQRKVTIVSSETLILRGSPCPVFPGQHWEAPAWRTVCDSDTWHLVGGLAHLPKLVSSLRYIYL